MEIINLDRFTLKNNITILHTRKCYANTTARNKLDVMNFSEIQLSGQQLNNNIRGLGRHHAMGMNDDGPQLIDRHCIENKNKNEQNEWATGWVTRWVTLKV